MGQGSSSTFKPECAPVRAFAKPLRRGRRLFRLGKIFYRVQLAVAVGYADAGRVHVGVEDVGAVLRRLHEALMNGGGVRSLVGEVRRLPGPEECETWGTRLLVGYFN